MFITKRRERGDTIVEVMIATILLGLILAGAYVVVNNSSLNETESQQRSEALLLMQNQVEQIRDAATNNIYQIGDYIEANGPDTWFHSDFCFTNTNTVSTIYDAHPSSPLSPLSCYFDSAGNNSATPSSDYQFEITDQLCPTFSLPTSSSCGGGLALPEGTTVVWPYTALVTATFTGVGDQGTVTLQLPYRVYQSCYLVTCGHIPALKPVIYLYPTQAEKVNVKVSYPTGFAASTPAYNPQLGWTVLAQPNGTLTDPSSGLSYPYLYWEGNPAPFTFNMSQGFVVSSADSKAFLTKELASIGLNQSETSAFLAYWLPKVQANKYTLIHFASDDYTNLVKLSINPQPKSVLRVFMVEEPLTKPVSVTPQVFPTFHRIGFTVVEWGGAIL